MYTLVMRWSIRLGEAAGIGIRVHVTFFLLLLWVAMSAATAERELATVAGEVLFILALFGCVVLHELGHALTAKRYGIRTRDITLLPIGGLARLERMPDNPREEFVVALAGPAVNVVIAGLLYALILLTAGLELPDPQALGEASFVARLLSVNVALVVFNLLPAFPMDGGRVLRSLLAMKLEYSRATSIASALGQSLAFVFVFLGLFGNPILLLIGVFVWIGAAQEASMAQMRAVFHGVPVREAMITEFETVNAHDRLERGSELILKTAQQDFPVVNHDREVVGVLTWKGLREGLASLGQDAAVERVMEREFESVEERDSLQHAFQLLQSSGLRSMPVTRSGALCGLLTMDNLGEYMMIKSALEQKRRRPAGLSGRR